MGTRYTWKRVTCSEEVSLVIGASSRPFKVFTTHSGWRSRYFPQRKLPMKSTCQQLKGWSPPEIETRQHSFQCTCLWIFKKVELYTVNRWIVCYVSVKLLKQTNKKKPDMNLRRNGNMVKKGPFIFSLPYFLISAPHFCESRYVV